MRNAIANGKSFFKQKKCGVLSLLGLEMKSISGFEAFRFGSPSERSDSERRPRIA